jgi:hypothetical protein
VCNLVGGLGGEPANFVAQKPLFAEVRQVDSSYTTNGETKTLMG